MCGRCEQPLHMFEPIIVTDANFADEVERSTLPVLIDMWAPWCGPSAHGHANRGAVGPRMGVTVRVGKLDIDDSPATAARFNVRSIPTLLILKDGREIDRLVERRRSRISFGGSSESSPKLFLCRTSLRNAAATCC